MTPERWEKVLRILDQVRPLPATDREQAVVALCGDCEELLAEVQHLLTLEESSRGALDEPLLGTEFDLGMTTNHLGLDRISEEGADTRWLPAAGSAVGQYTIVRQIGSGGMGVVYEAQQQSPHRSVALKIHRYGMLSRTLARRFRNEVEILARLDHPNIATVYEAGVHCPDDTRDDGGMGVPYFAMQYIDDAMSLTEYADVQGLDVRARLELFAQVCDGVQHGHQKGVIHRDLKPSNVLVGTDGQPKVIDFGVAKATDSDLAVTTMATFIGQLIGTVQYMSPEQCREGADRLAIDARSDVYSLGVMLYVLLTGELPYEVSRTSIVSAAMTICEAEVKAPSTVRRQLRGSHDAIILKALQRDPERRYQSAGQLAADIRAYLAGDPVQARSQTTVDRVARMWRRHPVACAAIAAFCITLSAVAGTALTAWYLLTQPANVMYDQESGTAVLQAATGRELHTWRSVTYALEVTRATEHGGDRVVLISYNRNAEGPYAGRACIYTFGNPEAPALSLPLPVIPAEIRAAWASQLSIGPEQDMFSAAETSLADIWPELPGPELVVTYWHGSQFPSALQIYGLDGTLYYSRWHKGHLRTHWDSDSRMLICAGRRNDWLYDKPGFEDFHISQAVNVIVLAALKPRLSTPKDTMFLTITDELLPDVEWYRYLAPNKAWEDLDCELPQYDLRPDGSTSWRLPAQIIEQNVGLLTGITFCFDQRTGSLTDVIPHNGYQAIDGLPRIGQYHLYPYPVTVEELREAMGMSDAHVDGGQ